MDLLTLSIAKKYTDDSIIGADGINKGEKGDPGYTPVRGVDYWTEDDKAIIMSEIAMSEDAPAIICEKSGSVVSVNDASDRLLKGLTIYGKTTQAGTPTPDNPMELVSAGASGAINTTVCGKNLYDINSYLLTQGKWVTTEGFISTDTALAATESYIPVSHVAGQQLTLNKRSGGSNPSIAFYDADKVFISNIRNSGGTANTPITFTVPENAVYMRFTTVAGAEDIQIELGTVSTEYEPYKGNTITTSTPNGLPGIPVSSGGNYTDENGQQWICDEIDFARGVYVQRVQVLTYNGTETWKTFTESGAKVFEFELSKPGYRQGIMSTFGYKAEFDYAKGNIFIAGANLLSLLIMPYGDYTLDTWKAHLAEKASAGTPLTVQYYLKTPIETPLSAEEMAAFAALHSNKPNTTVYNDAGAGMAVEYVADTKNYIDQKLAAISAALLNA